MKALWMTIVSGFAVLLGCASTGDSLETALLREDWPLVLQQVKASDQTPQMRTISAHAYIALNRNNEATCILSLLSPADLARWDTWTEAFVTTNPDTAIAHYLRGDSIARQGQLQAALAEFERSLALDKEHVLTLNAIGVVRSFRGDWDGAFADFARAVALRGDFADAWSSQGLSNLHGRRSVDGALDAFNSALKIDPDFVVATAGKAFAEMALGRWDEGNS